MRHWVLILVLLGAPTAHADSYDRLPYISDGGVGEFFADIFSNPCARKGIQTPDRPTPGVIALTFDDGPALKSSVAILETLKTRSVPATFFAEGQNVQGRERILSDVRESGYLVGNHSFSHPNFVTIPLAKQKSEIDSAAAELGNWLSDQRYFRFPFGNATCEAYDYLVEQKYRVVGWNIDVCDWAFSDGVITVKEKSICQVADGQERDFISHAVRMAKLSKGGILLMHDRLEFTAAHLPRLLDELSGAGFSFVELSDTVYFPKLNQ